MNEDFIVMVKRDSEGVRCEVDVPSATELMSALALLVYKTTSNYEDATLMLEIIGETIHKYYE